MVKHIISSYIEINSKTEMLLKFSGNSEFFLGRVPARMVLYFLSLSGFLVSFVMRNDINIAIVAMVEQSPESSVSNSSSRSCFVADDTSKSTIQVSWLFLTISIRYSQLNLTQKYVTS